jgi:hypothetical protein
MDFYERKHQEYYVTPPSLVIQTRELFGGPSFFIHIYPTSSSFSTSKIFYPFNKQKLQDLEP